MVCETFTDSLLEGQSLSNEVFICDISKSATEGVFTWMQHSLAVTRCQFF